jgi:hypothetical protein
MENFAVEAMRLDELWKPIWKITADDPDRKEKLKPNKWRNLFRFFVAVDDLDKELESSQKWFLEGGLQDAGKRLIKYFRTDAHELAKTLLCCYPMVDDETPKEIVEQILSHRRSYEKSFSELSERFASGIALLKKMIVSCEWHECHSGRTKRRPQGPAPASAGQELANAVDAFGVEANRIIRASRPSVKKCQTDDDFYRSLELRLMPTKPFHTAYARVRSAMDNAEGWLWKLWGPDGWEQIGEPVNNLFAVLLANTLFSGIEAPDDLEKSTTETHARVKASAEEIQMPDLKKLVDTIHSVAVAVRSAAEDGKVHSIAPQLPPSVGIGRDRAQPIDVTKEQWKAPKGYIGSKTILSDYEVPRTTLQGWHERDMASGTLKNVRKDPQTGENYYPQKWFEKRFAHYKSRGKT